MSVPDYGTYGQVLMIISFAQGLFALGLGKVIFTYLANEDIDQSESLYSNISVGFVSGAIAAMLVCLLAPLIADQFDNQRIVYLLRIYAWVIPFFLSATAMNATLIFFGKVKESAVITVASNLLKVSLVVMAVQLYSSLPLIFIALIVTALVRLLLCYSRLPKKIKLKKKWSLEISKRQLKSGWPLGIASMLGVAFWSTDGYMVSAMLDVEQFAIYKNGAFQIPFISSIYGSITAILLPDVSKFFFKKNFDEIVRLKKKVIINTAMLIFPVVVFCIIFAKPLIITYLSIKYEASYPIFMVYNFMLLARFTSYDDLFIATNNNSKMPLIYIMALVVNIILNYFMIISWGPIGSAVASVISFYFLISILFYKGVGFIGRKPKEFFDLPKIFGCIILTAIFSLMFYYGYSFVNGSSTLLLLFMGLYMILVYHIIIKFRFIDKTIITGILMKVDKQGRIVNVFNKIYA